MNLKAWFTNLKTKISKLPIVGLRTIKTALSVVICLVLYEFVINKFSASQDALTACIAAVISMKDTIENSVKYGSFRLIGTGIGGAIGIVSLWVSIHIFHDNFRLLFTAAGIILVIYICNLIEKNEAVTIACVVYLIIMVSSDVGNPYMYALYRILDTAIGIIVSVAVNKYFSIRKSKKIDKILD